jgi:hypothetical protein
MDKWEHVHHTSSGRYFWIKGNDKGYVIAKEYGKERDFEIWKYLKGATNGDRWNFNKYKCINSFPNFKAARAAYKLIVAGDTNG